MGRVGAIQAWASFVVQKLRASPRMAFNEPPTLLHSESKDIRVMVVDY